MQCLGAFIEKWRLKNGFGLPEANQLRSKEHSPPLICSSCMVDRVILSRLVARADIWPEMI